MPRWSSLADAFLNSLRSAAGERADAASEIVEQIAHWGSHLAKNASERWLLAVVDPKPCALKPKPGHACGYHALARCDVCGIPVCLAHARIDFVGNAICFGCVRDAQRKQGPAISEEITNAFKTLGLRKSASWQEVSVAHRKLVLKFHPDRATTIKDRMKRETKMKEINAAYEVLKKHYEQRKEAA